MDLGCRVCRHFLIKLGEIQDVTVKTVYFILCFLRSFSLFCEETEVGIRQKSVIMNMGPSKGDESVFSIQLASSHPFRKNVVPAFFRITGKIQGEIMQCKRFLLNIQF